MVGLHVVLEVSEVLVDPQCRERKDTEPPDDCQNSKPQDSVRAVVNAPHQSVSIPGADEKRASVQEPPNDKATTRSDPEEMVR